jgi:hypothetical protein
MRHGFRIAVMGGGVRLAALVLAARLIKEASRLGHRHGHDPAGHVALEDENPTSDHTVGGLDRASWPERSLACAPITRGIGRSDQKSAGALDTLAAASAEAGDFEAAVRWETRAIELETDREDKANYSARLALYREKTPYRDAKP